MSAEAFLATIAAVFIGNFVWDVFDLTILTPFAQRVMGGKGK